MIWGYLLCDTNARRHFEGDDTLAGCRFVFSKVPSVPLLVQF